ncbi:xanthine dehydrogenase accessory protein XdhC [Alisedimentitalea sp. MJ-SS2]|uniref:xanthine dehydrogenase accessory protein XdhC n=1 Tax=Aliisedimentitalea sp. MJ-SS2 TaxID=3049795 RepID=UPI002915357C|nr:xanthine dehydrogenase accessory protein XdhC [Alisedimentitalea sp. MJ-SS2]MDU8929489.1 xanthine dehydrogenase accessory protein XdhC [Alisedimentitalea sp. MJ-SS2]
MSVFEFLSSYQEVVRVMIARTEGSSPREVGAEMFVSISSMAGTIGGGQLEYMALDQARAMLKTGELWAEMDVPLGPEIGQCCGGRVVLMLERMGAKSRAETLEQITRTAEEMPQVLVFGAGHVGRALIRALAPLPVRARLVDSRSEELAMADCADKCLTALPENEIHTNAYGAGVVIATHDHALDFLLAAEALKRGDATYVGMIGSATKRARFERWLREHDPEVNAGVLTCPMGKAGLGDKRPEVIAAFVVAELMQAFADATTVRDRMEAVT